MSLPKNFYKNLFKKISIIRLSEDKIKKYYHEDEMKTPMHMSKGEELVVAAAVEVFGKKSDYFGYYRSHALYLSLTQDLKKFFGEMYGKKTGENLGVAGSMHIFNPKKNLKAVSAIVSSTISTAVGNSYGNMLNNNKKITLSFFGDGATEEGVFHESINFAALKKLPIVFICLDNNIAVDVPIKERQSYKIINLAKSYNLKVFNIDSFNLEKVSKSYINIKNYIENKKKPVFVLAKYHRHLQHIGMQSDFEKKEKNFFERQNYRSEILHNRFVKFDPFVLICKKVEKIYGKSFVQKNLKSLDEKIENVILKTKKEKTSDKKKIFGHVFN